MVPKILLSFPKLVLGACPCREAEQDVYERRSWGEPNGSKPLAPMQSREARPRNTSEPLNRTTVLIVLAAAVCAGLAAGLSG